MSTHEEFLYSLLKALDHRLVLLDEDREAMRNQKRECISRGDPASAAKCDDEIHVVTCRRMEVHNIRESVAEHLKAQEHKIHKLLRTARA